jgi:phosphate:Na+ symporter
MPLAARRLKLGFAFSHDDQAELRRMFERLRSNLKAASSVYMTEDERAARVLADEKVVFRDLVGGATAAHFRGLRQRSLAARETSALYLDLVQALKRVNDHLVAGAAYTVLDRSGELMASRVRRPESSGLAAPPVEPG